jgi:murein hydrolase activator
MQGRKIVPRPERDIYSTFKAALTAACFLLTWAASGGLTPVLAGPDEELVQLRQKLAASNARQAEISARLQLLSGEILSLKSKSVTAAARLQKLDQGLIDTEDRLQGISDVEKQTLKTLSDQNEGLADTLSALLQLSRQPEGSLIGSPQNLIDTLRAATLLKAAIPALKEQAGELSAQLDQLAILRDQYVAEQQKYQALRESRLSEQAVLNELLAAKRSAQASLVTINKKESRTQKKLSGDARNVVALLKKLETQKQVRLKTEKKRIEREIARQQELQQQEAARQAEQARKQTQEDETNREQQVAAIPTPKPSRKSSAPKAVSKPEKTGQQLASLSSFGSQDPFSKKKGTLPLPVGGKIISRYGKTGNPQQRNGIVIETRNQAAVISPYDGQIAFAGQFRHYGLLLIIDHGEGYHTLLAGLGSIDGDVGQLLLAGEPVGRMKNGENGKPTLYMELRVKGSPVNPIPWFAAGYRKVSG